MFTLVLSVVLVLAFLALGVFAFFLLNVLASMTVSPLSNFPLSAS